LIIDAEAEGRRLQTDARRNAEEVKAAAAVELDRLRREAEEHRKRRDALAAENTVVAATHERLQTEVSTLEENLEDISFGIYKPFVPM
jgi:peptidoglycan hydrolase CwlO-like protein